ncbi:MAG: hypothetical protein KKF46_04280 [Nanoarchaeota archaeon]|nr:hypothetical protein [Nanoarchaeota archaeon]MBU1321553.1 hypothetical protein [Nanoarchaeota archaeon]MBU1597087.1 hypothetical protein [Nanoarchaeota archaeon]MBU2441868.1 hypothetical protein [Nanoarchaeota archaeon]
MNNITTIIVSFAILVLFIVGCAAPEEAPEDNTGSEESQEQAQESQETPEAPAGEEVVEVVEETITGSLTEVDNLDSELSDAELDDIDSQLAELDW